MIAALVAAIYVIFCLCLVWLLNLVLYVKVCIYTYIWCGDIYVSMYTIGYCICNSLLMCTNCRMLYIYIYIYIYIYLHITKLWMDFYVSAHVLKYHFILISLSKLNTSLCVNHKISSFGCHLKVIALCQLTFQVFFCLSFFFYDHNYQDKEKIFITQCQWYNI